jgi:hypothetical protein
VKALIAFGMYACVSGLVGCAGAPPSASESTVVMTLPTQTSRFAPSQSDVDGTLTGDSVTETESCAGCHPDADAQWRSSAHAFASFNNPIYRVVVDRFREAEGNTKSRFCAGCHDVALLVDGAMDGPVAPDDSRAHGGVTCRVCHGIEATRPDGNASYVLRGAPIPIPRDGDDESLRAHRSRMALAPLRTAAMCGTCHRSFLSPATGNKTPMTGQDDLGAWQRSVYAGSFGDRIDAPVEPAECRTCHMPLEGATRGDAAAKNGQIRSHRFAGAQTWLAAMRGDTAQVAAAVAMLQGAASLDIATVTSSDGTRHLPADGAPVRAGQSLLLDVVVRNLGVGHRFQGGVLDAQDTFIEVEAHDAQGRRFAASGTLEQASGGDASAHKLRVVQIDDDGAPVLERETNRFRAPVINHTIAPRDAQVVRYRLDVPAQFAAGSLPIRITARLRHRSRSLELARAVCAAAPASRSVEFTAETRERGTALDLCAPEPVTEVARSEAWIGQGSAAKPVSSEPAWRRLFNHGLGLLHALQEDVGAARSSLQRALDLSPPGDERAQAMVLHALAQVDIREGMTAEAMGHLDQAEALVPGDPAIAHARGQALADVWQWKDAVSPLRAASLQAPMDDVLLSHLAVALASADDPAAALDVAGRALALSPRDPDMLRVQATVLEQLGAAPSDVLRAREAFAQWRSADDAPALKSKCARRFDWCALERTPVHTHVLRP